MTMIVDPYLLSIPIREHFSSQDVFEYMKRLQTWETEFHNNPNKFSLSHSALSVMQRLGISPSTDNLNAFWKKFGITEVSYQDIAPTCSGILINAQKLEDLSGFYDTVSEVEINEGNETVIPEEIRGRLNQEVATEFFHSLIYAAYNFRKDGKKNGWSIVTSPIKSDDSSLKTQATLTAIQDDTSLVNMDISYEWPLLFDPEHIYASQDIHEVFQTHDLYKVLEVARCRLNSQGNRLPRIDYSNIKFGQKFLESIMEPRIQRRPGYKEDVARIFEAIVFSVLNIWSYGCDKHHTLNKKIPLRNSDERTRRSNLDPNKHDKGSRIEAITGANPIHIHYWRCYDGSYEFSNITDDHDDPTIYE